jgi:hypothetical protein
VGVDVRDGVGCGVGVDEEVGEGVAVCVGAGVFVLVRVSGPCSVDGETMVSVRQAERVTEKVMINSRKIPDLFFMVFLHEHRMVL